MRAWVKIRFFTKNMHKLIDCHLVSNIWKRTIVSLDSPSLRASNGVSISLQKSLGRPLDSYYEDRSVFHQRTCRSALGRHPEVKLTFWIALILVYNISKNQLPILIFRTSPVVPPHELRRDLSQKITLGICVESSIWIEKILFYKSVIHYMV